MENVHYLFTVGLASRNIITNAKKYFIGCLKDTVMVLIDDLC